MNNIQTAFFLIGMATLLHGMFQMAICDNKLLHKLNPKEIMPGTNPFIGHPIMNTKITFHPERYLTEEGLTIYRKAQRLWYWHMAIFGIAIIACIVLENLK